LFFPLGTLHTYQGGRNGARTIRQNGKKKEGVCENPHTAPILAIPIVFALFYPPPHLLPDASLLLLEWY